MDGVTSLHTVVVQQCEGLYVASLVAADTESVYEEHHMATWDLVAASTIIASLQLTTRSLN